MGQARGRKPPILIIAVKPMRKLIQIHVICHIFHHKRKSENDNIWFTQAFAFVVVVFFFRFSFGRLNLLGALLSVFGRQRLMGCILSKTGHARNSKNSLVTYVHQVLPIGEDVMSPSYWRSTLTNVGTKSTQSTQMTECI